MEKMRINKKYIIRVLFFAVILGGILFVFDGILVRKDSRKKYYEFFDQAKEYDILFTGISHMEVGVWPLEIYNDYGFTSFNLGESGNIPYTNYWTLKNALDYADPKLVVIDIRRLNLEDKMLDNLSVAPLDSFPISKNKIEMAMDLFGDNSSRLEFLFHTLKYHARWEELTQNDFRQIEFRTDKGAFEYEKWSLTAAIPSEMTTISDDDKAYGSDISVGALERMIEMCQNRGIEVMLVELPYVANPEDKRLSNGVVDIANKYGINYLDFLHLDGIVNYNTDMNDSQGHVNDSGAKKVSEYIGQYISEHYNLQDHRGDDVYADWEEDYKSFVEYKADRLNSMENLDQRLIVSADEGVSTAIYVKKTANEKLDFRMRELINNMKTYDDAYICNGNEEDSVYIVDNSALTTGHFAGNGSYKAEILGNDLDVSISDSGVEFDYKGEEVISSNADIVMLSINSADGNLIGAMGFNLITDEMVSGIKAE